ncbi:MAG: prepilin peptidase [Sulfurimonas sp.]|uniref:prepilin peptidase n=1 Tax=Sulfurimonas sp. TaxID=2022749 RepID=UPI00260E98A3|nr:A24 family peptidase [Sulfurimonas sp.]MCW8895048.1 prepilin peptidase [Sulfurimonas sp.]MCW8953620.1 prepilin peptidase [Sulfurimonas sp.]MCW9067333.1 prepilin peptidase [Sulfurimonas sp.]
MELTIAFILGVAIGSFLNVIILRIPKDESIVFGGSHCTKCNTPLKPWHNIPLLSWVFLRGKCSFCKAKISIQYPLVELISGLIFLVLVNKFGFSFPVILIVFSFFMLLSLSVIDFRYKMVPDSLNLLAMTFAIFGAWSIPGVFTNFQNALLFAGGFTLLRFAMSYMLTSSAHRHANKTITPWTKNYHTYPFIEALGEGDIMVAATMGALLGVKLTLVAIFLSAILALPVMMVLTSRSKERVTVPFVPFLVMATFIVYIFDSPILDYIKANY